MLEKMRAIVAALRARGQRIRRHGQAEALPSMPDAPHPPLPPQPPQAPQPPRP